MKIALSVFRYYFERVERLFQLKQYLHSHSPISFPISHSPIHFLQIAYIFKMLFYFDSTVVNNQMKYYLTAIKRKFMENQCGLQYVDTLWLVVESAFTKISRNFRLWVRLFGTSWCKVIKALWLYGIVQTGKAKKVNVKPSL